MLARWPSSSARERFFSVQQAESAGLAPDEVTTRPHATWRMILSGISPVSVSLVDLRPLGLLNQVNNGQEFFVVLASAEDVRQVERPNEVDDPRRQRPHAVVVKEVPKKESGYPRNVLGVEDGPPTTVT